MTADRSPSFDASARSREHLDRTVSADSADPHSSSLRTDRPGRADYSADSNSLKRFRAGDRIAQFAIREEVGRGGMGVVYRAFDERLEREVALKFLPAHLVAHPESKDRFLREARAASALDHPNVGTVHEIGETARGEPFLVMSYYSGYSLEKQIRRGPLPVDTALDVAAQLADALDAAHERGLIHRDLKPSNVLIPEEGPIKLVDFGLARWVTESALTEPGRVLGTVAYMSPEQVRGDELDGRCDLWALGVVLYEMLTGSRPFAARYEHALLYAIAHEEPASLRSLRPEVPTDVDHLVTRCLSKDPNDRYESARTLSRTLRRAMAHRENRPPLPHLSSLTEDLVPTEETTPAARLFLSRIRGSRWHWIRAGVAAAVLVAAFLGWGLLLGGLASDASGSAPAVPPGSRIAVLAVPTPGTPDRSDTDPLLDELSVVITHLLTRLDPASGLDLEIVPSTEMGNIRGVREARAAFGIEYILTLGRLTDPTGSRLSLNLVDARSLDQLRSIALPLLDAEGNVHPEAETDQLGAAVARLFGLPSAPALDRALGLRDGVDRAAHRYYELGRTQLAAASDPSDLEAAAQLFEWALEAEESYPEAFAGLAEVYDRLFERTGDPSLRERASRYGERAEAGSSPRPSLHVSRALLGESRGNYEKALVDYKIAAALDSTSTEVHRGMGRTYEALGRYEDAEQAHRRAIALAPNDYRAHADLGNFLLRRGRFAEAQDAYRSVTRLAPATAAVGHVNLGTSHYYRGELGAARSAFQEALRHPQVEPRHRLTAWSNLGTVHYYEGRAEQAARAYRRALAVDSTNHQLWGNLGSALRRLEGTAPSPSSEIEAAFRTADRLAERSLAVNPNQPEILISRAAYQYELGRTDRAREFLASAIEAAPEQMHIQFFAGHLLEQLGDRRRAAQFLRTAIEAGYPRWVLERDPELEAIRTDPIHNPLGRQVLPPPPAPRR